MDDCDIERVISCWDPIPRHLRIDPRAIGLHTWYPSESPPPWASTGHASVSWAKSQHEVFSKDSGTPATASQSDPLSMLDQSTYGSGKPPVPALGINMTVNDSESVLLMRTATNCNSLPKCESVCSSSVLRLESSFLPFTNTSGSSHSLTADDSMSRALPSSTLFGLDVSPSTRFYHRRDHKTFNERDNMLAHQKCERRSAKAQVQAKAVEVDVNTDGSELFSHDDSRFMMSSNDEDPEAASNPTSTQSSHLQGQLDEQDFPQPSECNLPKSPNVDFRRLAVVHGPGAIFIKTPATPDCDGDTDRESTDSDVEDAQPVTDDEYPSQETYDHAVKRGGREWRRKREEEKAVARRTFKVPSDWNDAAKVNEFLIESKRIWQ